MTRIAVLCIVLLSFCLIGCKKKKGERSESKIAECKELQVAGAQDPEKDCRKCCDDANAWGYFWTAEAGCSCR